MIDAINLPGSDDIPLVVDRDSRDQHALRVADQCIQVDHAGNGIPAKRVVKDIGLGTADDLIELVDVQATAARKYCSMVLTPRYMDLAYGSIIDTTAT